MRNIVLTFILSSTMASNSLTMVSTSSSTAWGFGRPKHKEINTTENLTIRQGLTIQTHVRKIDNEINILIEDMDRQTGWNPLEHGDAALRAHMHMSGFPFWSIYPRPTQNKINFTQVDIENLNKQRIQNI